MSMNATLRWVVALGLLAGTTAAAAAAKDQDAGVQQVLRKAQGVVRQLTQEKAALEAEKAQWLQEKAGLEARLKTLEAAAEKLPALQAEAERYKSAVERSRGDLEAQTARSREREQALLQKHREVVAKAKDIRSDNELLVNAVQEREQWIGDCGERNKNLRQVSQEVVKQYKDKGLWESLVELEPFTGIGEVRTEATAEEYRYKIQQLKSRPFEAQASAPADSPKATTEEDEDEQ